MAAFSRWPAASGNRSPAKGCRRRGKTFQGKFKSSSKRLKAVCAPEVPPRGATMFWSAEFICFAVQSPDTLGELPGDFPARAAKRTEVRAPIETNQVQHWRGRRRNATAGRAAMAGRHQ